MRFLALLPLVALAPAAPAAEPVDYRRDIKPLLQERCYACHGSLAQKGKLRVDSGANMIRAGVVVPGKPAESELVKRITAADDETRMPPEGHPLKPEQVAKLTAWVEQGAKVPADDAQEPDPRDHWAFRPPVRSPLPVARNPKHEIRNEIDRFIAAKWAEKGLAPVAPADKRVLLRRVYIDLTGLPPTPAQAEAFLSDASPNAYEKVVDQLLASPQYGERWGRHFLDVWRYSDWWGLGAELRNSQRHIWHWRDWVVESFNADLGYDEMVRQMLAADELYPTDPQKLRATGYLARPYFLFNRTTWLDEVVEHTGKGFLGLTLNCAKCHDHKYDPLKQSEYYSFRAVFEPYQVRTDLVPGEPDATKDGIPRAFDCNPDAKTPFHVRGDERNPDPNRTVLPGVPQFLNAAGFKITAVKLPPEAYQPLRRPEIAETLRTPAVAKLAAAKERLARAEALVGARAAFLAWASLPARTAVDAATKELAALEAAVADPAKAAPPLGSVKSAESNVEPAASKARPFPDTSTGRRTALANWLTDRQNPLVARVAVNHLWLRHFGQPLVANVFEFGRKGTPPTHPELLDWLAVELMEHKWSFKHLHKLMVTSAAYRLSSSSAGAEASAKLDPENRALWRMNPVRMEAQVVRDSLLHLTGDLDLARGGPPVPMAAQDASKRRSMYFFHSHNEHNKLLDVFDNANVLDCYRRTESIVPQQALALSNSRLAMATAAKLNDQLHARLGSADDAQFVAAAFETILGTPPTRDELAACVEALAELRAVLKTAKDAGKRARLQVVQALINHNDFVTVR
ncbi:colicin uptake protein : Protein containing planctomycete cytochrome C domain protein OS=Rhodopirellula baltica SWK14 GN=RBSWK_05713 PE=4 SV=1: PSCyt1: PSCyt2: PSD1 [Gemmataceae bacterium]|nr:colicin uptake protein : Protein containing planctomycete cytochrome C domain protein OS=Rhodopirellula baltica SWK14 GN=RBSWK_05713 PE=4 SV=1: PSCyt1: PSCyt2: PSD1 [Gemmataceae bacterium]VTU02006.1 colicin uptake protein : Protein containing planctomycete cytochrome C domain protein OS=Rhodopirellula baltica SWK14 GN=RBSWK_05713 PE=4 SV=1: PSCyt1: PSCyt2: PSD1 [Gemmataceae bacterium]